MSLLRFCSFLAALALLVVAAPTNPVDAQVAIQIQPAPGQPSPFQPGRFVTGPLLPDAAKEKLNLTAEQSEKIEKIQKEFTDKTSDAEAKIKEAREKVLQNRDREGLAKIRELTQEIQKTREEYLEKARAVFTPEQTKIYEEAIQQMRRRDPQGNPFFGRNTRVDLTLGSTQIRLKLTAEQKEKIEKMQKEFEEKTLEVLTPEQKKQLEEMKKQARPGFRPQTRPNP